MTDPDRCPRDATPYLLRLEPEPGVALYECFHGHSLRVEATPREALPARGVCRGCGTMLDSPSAKGMAALYCISCRAEKRATWSTMRRQKPRAVPPVSESRAWKAGLYA